MFAVCPAEVEAKVRPFLKNVQFLISSQCILYWPAENCAVLGPGGVGWGRQERKGGGHSELRLVALADASVETWKTDGVQP